MVATALALNLKRNKSVSAINNFISTVTYDDTARKKLIPKQSYNLAKMHKEIAQEIIKYSSEGIVFQKEEMNIAEIVSSILKAETRNYQAAVFISKYRKIEVVILIALFLGIICAILSVLFRNVVDVYLFCFLVWILSCVSLWITLKLIIKDWKDNQYGKRTKN